MDTGVGSAAGGLGSLSFWVVERRWARLALLAAFVGYVGLMIVLAPRGEPAAPILMAVPILVAGAWFGLKVALVVTGVLLVVTAVILETVGVGVAETLSTYRGLPILMLVIVGVVVGRLHDVSVAMAKEVQRARLAEHDLRAAEARLQNLLDAKDELIASVGHELRTPLTAVLGFAELLRVGGETEMTESDRHEMVEFIAREAFDLTGIVDDLLVAARLEVDRLDVTKVPTSLRSQVAQVLEAWDNTDRPGIEVTGDNIRAVADPARVRQILRNLITNAIRYGGNQIAVTIDADSQGAFVEVADNGKGLPMSEWERIFEPHYRYQPDISKPAGSGLGLTVSRGLAEKMDGSLTYRYDGQQSRFRLVLPEFEPTQDS
ncbi:MAG TPA: HAMP domain-containing sensor histidine kinase [Acidimicrobiia bacterium]|nr:HAMP domain-containing sensor histidine kinase [Acidimicrobiia bacterium]